MSKMPKPRKCHIVPEILRRLEYLEETNPRSSEMLQLIEKYEEIEEQQVKKFDYLATREEKLRVVREQIQNAANDANFQLDLTAQEAEIEALAKQLEVREHALGQLYAVAAAVCNLPAKDRFDGAQGCAALRELEAGILALGASE